MAEKIGPNNIPPVGTVVRWRDASGRRIWSYFLVYAHDGDGDAKMIFLHGDQLFEEFNGRTGDLYLSPIGCEVFAKSVDELTDEMRELVVRARVRSATHG